jgi:type II secretory pathway pseudopilin PulG
MRPAPTTDLGETLVELLVAVAILGIAVVAIITAMGTSVLVSTLHREQSQATAVLVSAAEAVKSPTVAAAPCGSPTTAYTTAAATVTRPTGWAAPTVAVRYWDGDSFELACSGTATTRRLQQVTVTVKSPDGRTKESVSVVKREGAMS